MSEWLQQVLDPNSTRTYASAAAEQKPQIKSAAGMLIHLSILNVNAAARFVYVMDAIGDGTPFSLILAPFSVGIGATVDKFIPWPKRFKTGFIVAASSGAAGTYAASGTADLIVTAHYY